MRREGEAARYVDQLQDELRQIGAELPSEFSGRFLHHARTLGPDGYGDLGALVMLECLEAKERGETLDRLTIWRILDRVRKRAVRQLSHWRRLQPLADVKAVDPGESPGHRFVLLDTLRNSLSGLAAEELLMLELWAINRPSEEAARSLGMSAAAFRQRVHRVLTRLRAAVGNTGSPQ